MKCEVCKTRVAQLRCRRCGKAICSKCHFHHGLCIECRSKLRQSEDIVEKHHNGKTN